MDPATLYFFLVPEVLVGFVGLLLVFVFGKEFIEHRRAVHIGKNGTPASPTHYWGRYQAAAGEKETVQIVTRE